MTWEIVLGISALLGLISTAIVIYKNTAGSKVDKHISESEGTEKILQEFLIAYSGEYRELKQRITMLEESYKNHLVQSDAMKDNITNIVVELRVIITKFDNLYDTVKDHINKSN